MKCQNEIGNDDDTPGETKISKRTKHIEERPHFR